MLLTVLMLTIGAIRDARDYSVPWWCPAIMLSAATATRFAAGTGVTMIHGPAGQIGSAGPIALALTTALVEFALLRRGLCGAADPPALVACTLVLGAPFLVALGILLLPLSLYATAASTRRVPLFPPILAAAVACVGWAAS